MRTYAAAKERITRAQTAEDFLVLNAEDVSRRRWWLRKTKAQMYWFSGTRPVKQGAFVHGEEYCWFSAKEGGEPSR